MHFLCDAIDLKQSVEGTLKVQGKSSAIFLDEVHFIVNLYSFSLSLVPLANPSFPKVSNLPTPRQINFKNSPSFSVNPYFLRISQLPGQNQQNHKQSQRYILSYFYELPSALSLSKIIVEFSLKLLYSTMCGKNFQIYGFHISRKCIDSGHFYSYSSPPKTGPQVLVITPQAEGN